MKRLIIASLLATAAAATPAMARDGSWYAGIEGGFLWAKNMHGDIDYGTGSIDDFLVVDHSGGYDIDGIVGYDFGMFRAEGELAFKRAKHNEYSYTDYYGDTYNYDADGHTNVTSGMINLLFDAGNEDGFSFYAGPGIGYAKTKITADSTDFGRASISDSGLAWQAIAGVRYAVSPNVDVGLKYRYFVGSKVKDDFDADFGTDASLDFGRFKSSSLLASLVFNFAPPPPPAPAPYIAPAPVVEPAPQMQTCYDGSMIPVTAMCPSPPAPVVTPAPAMPGERG